MSVTPRKGSASPRPARRGGETRRHYELKRAALAWLVQRGFRAVALEVAAPWRGRVVDAAGAGFVNLAAVVPGAPAGRALALGIVECKQSRADLLKDCGSRDALAGRWRTLAARLEGAKERIRAEEPGLFTGDTLFPEVGAWRYAESRDAGFRRLLVETDRCERAVFARVKFDLLRRRRFAHLHYLFTPPGLARPRDLPPGWGLIEVSLPRAGERESPTPGDAPPPDDPPAAGRLRREAEWAPVTPEVEARMLCRIAERGTAAALRDLGIPRNA